MSNGWRSVVLWDAGEVKLLHPRRGGFGSYRQFERGGMRGNKVASSAILQHHSTNINTLGSVRTALPL